MSNIQKSAGPNAPFFFVHMKSIVGTKIGPIQANDAAHAVELANAWTDKHMPNFGTFLRRKGSAGEYDKGTEFYEECEGYIVDKVTPAGEYLEDGGVFDRSGNLETAPMEVIVKFGVSDVFSLIQEKLDKDLTREMAKAILQRIGKDLEAVIVSAGNEALEDLVRNQRAIDVPSLPPVKYLGDLVAGDTVAWEGKDIHEAGMYTVVKVPEPGAQLLVDDATFVIKLDGGSEVSVTGRELLNE